ncbi:hypothetical protein GCM10027592_29570 [Spirosoma flavus]
MSETKNFDKLRAEKQELDILIDAGVKFSVPEFSLLRIFGKKTRDFVISEPYLGTMDQMSVYALRLANDFSEEKLKSNPIGESKRLYPNSRLCAKIIAIAVLNNYWTIKLFSGILARYFLWGIKPRVLAELTMIINTTSNIPDFTNSIRYLSANRTTKPTEVENPTEKEPIETPLVAEG